MRRFAAVILCGSIVMGAPMQAANADEVRQASQQRLDVAETAGQLARALLYARGLPYRSRELLLTDIKIQFNSTVRQLAVRALLQQYEQSGPGSLRDSTRRIDQALSRLNEAAAIAYSNARDVGLVDLGVNVDLLAPDTSLDAALSGASQAAAAGVPVTTPFIPTLPSNRPPLYDPGVGSDPTLSVAQNSAQVLGTSQSIVVQAVVIRIAENTLPRTLRLLPSKARGVLDRASDLRGDPDRIARVIFAPAMLKSKYYVALAKVDRTLLLYNVRSSLHVSQTLNDVTALVPAARKRSDADAAQLVASVAVVRKTLESSQRKLTTLIAAERDANRIVNNVGNQVRIALAHAQAPSELLNEHQGERLLLAFVRGKLPDYAALVDDITRDLKLASAVTAQDIANKGHQLKSDAATIQRTAASYVNGGTEVAAILRDIPFLPQDVRDVAAKTSKILQEGGTILTGFTTGNYLGAAAGVANLVFGGLFGGGPSAEEQQLQQVLDGQRQILDGLQAINENLRQLSRASADYYQREMAQLYKLRQEIASLTELTVEQQDSGGKPCDRVAGLYTADRVAGRATSAASYSEFSSQVAFDDLKQCRSYLLGLMPNDGDDTVLQVFKAQVRDGLEKRDSTTYGTITQVLRYAFDGSANGDQAPSSTISDRGRLIARLAEPSFTVLHLREKGAPYECALGLIAEPPTVAPERPPATSGTRCDLVKGRQRLSDRFMSVDPLYTRAFLELVSPAAAVGFARRSLEFHPVMGVTTINEGKLLPAVTTVQAVDKSNRPAASEPFALLVGTLRILNLATAQQAALEGDALLPLIAADLSNPATSEKTKGTLLKWLKLNPTLARNFAAYVVHSRFTIDVRPDADTLAGSPAFASILAKHDCTNARPCTPAQLAGVAYEYLTSSDYAAKRSQLPLSDSNYELSTRMAAAFDDVTILSDILPPSAAQAGWKVVNLSADAAKQCAGAPFAVASPTPAPTGLATPLPTYYIWFGRVEDPDNVPPPGSTAPPESPKVDVCAVLPSVDEFRRGTLQPNPEMITLLRSREAVLDELVLYTFQRRMEAGQLDQIQAMNIIGSPK
jgi:hypothetical protein